MCSIVCWAPPSPLMPEQASLFKTGIPLDSPLEGHLLWDLASITPGLARSHLFYFILFLNLSWRACSCNPRLNLLLIFPRVHACPGYETVKRCACYIKDSMHTAIHIRFELWKVPSTPSSLWLKSKHRFVQSHGTHHLFVSLVYLPPKCSIYEQHCGIDTPCTT